MKLVVATHNKGKIAEFAQMLADLQLEWLSLDEAGVTADVEETGLTFAANAWLKAEAY
ncbi:MAG: non-canonical purine NTP pyrophosphatase, partial [Chloroflexi bacterium]|nr:non-canonical purine NTP pyrophosphatase [Chloroflexota bacterium]